jgi:aspartate aminotransferase-like enzyme
MTPGPSEVYPEILATLAERQYVHYGHEWSAIYNETCQSLRPLFGTTTDPLLQFGSGSMVMEMGIANLLKKGDGAINVVTGYFGERWAEVLAIKGIHPHNVAAELGRTVSPEAVQKAFREHPDAKALVTVQVDTSTGVINPIDQYAEIAHKHGAFVIADSISAFGGAPVMTDKWGLDFCVGYAQKCLSSISGATPFALSKHAWEIVDGEEHEAGWYMNLKVIRRFIQEWGSWGHPYPTTIPVQAVVALREAVRIVQREGLANVFQRHQKAGLAVREAAKAMGVRLFAAEEVAAPTVTPIAIGDGLEKKVQSLLLEKHNIQVGGSLVAPMIRIGHMGRSATPQFILATISALEASLREVGKRIELGAGVAAAQKQLGT